MFITLNLFALPIVLGLMTNLSAGIIGLIIATISCILYWTLPSSFATENRAELMQEFEDDDKFNVIFGNFILPFFVTFTIGFLAGSVGRYFSGSISFI